MGFFKISERAIADTLFALCLQADAAFEEQLKDAIRSAGINVEIEPNAIDHRELLLFYCWLSHRIFPDQPKVMNALQTSYYLASINPNANADGQQLFQFVNQRFYEYDQAMSNASDPLDIVYVNRVVTPRILSSSPQLMVHEPRLEIMLTHLFTEWIVSVSKTIREMA